MIETGEWKEAQLMCRMVGTPDGRGKLEATYVAEGQQVAGAPLVPARHYDDRELVPTLSTLAADALSMMVAAMEESPTNAPRRRRC